MMRTLPFQLIFIAFLCADVNAQTTLVDDEVAARRVMFERCEVSPVASLMTCTELNIGTNEYVNSLTARSRESIFEELAVLNDSTSTAEWYAANTRFHVESAQKVVQRDWPQVNVVRFRRLMSSTEMLMRVCPQIERKSLLSMMEDATSIGFDIVASTDNYTDAVYFAVFHFHSWSGCTLDSVSFTRAILTYRVLGDRGYPAPTFVYDTSTSKFALVNAQEYVRSLFPMLVALRLPMAMPHNATNTPAWAESFDAAFNRFAARYVPDRSAARLTAQRLANIFVTIRGREITNETEKVLNFARNNAVRRCPVSGSCELSNWNYAVHESDLGQTSDARVSLTYWSTI
jgi:hypothetical protein